MPPSYSRALVACVISRVREIIIRAFRATRHLPFTTIRIVATANMTRLVRVLCSFNPQALDKTGREWCENDDVSFQVTWPEAPNLYWSFYDHYYYYFYYLMLFKNGSSSGHLRTCFSRG